VRRGAVGLGAAVALAALGAPLAARSQPPNDLPRERTGPQAVPPTTPGYAQPAPALVSPPSAPPRTTPSAPAADGLPVTALTITADPITRPPRPPPGWAPPREAGAALDHHPDEPLDADWVRRQFAQNGVPGRAGTAQALALVQLVNRAFLSAGYVNSGVVVRPAPGEGVLALHIVYGGLVAPAPGEPAISVAWNGGRAKGLDAGYVRDRLPSTAARPLSVAALERDFRLLAEDPAIRTINADLRPGARPGEASLALSVYPQDRFELYATAANNRSPSVGGERIALGGSVRNLLRAGDLFSAEVGTTRGVDDAEVGYAVPVLSPRNSLYVRAGYNDAAVVDSVLGPLDISAKERSVEAGITRKLLDEPLLPSSRPGRWSPARTLTMGGAVAWRESRSYLFGEPFSFAPGAVDGRSRYTALRLTGDYVARNVDQVFAASVTATFGLEGTRTDVPGLPNPKPHFHAVLTQLNYARRLSAGGLELRGRLSGQWADGLLYSGERFSAGGEATVRGYRENLLLADRGAVGSLELAQPLRLSKRRMGARAFDWDAFTVSAFTDGALVRNDVGPQPKHSISSVGASLAWAPSEALSARVTYAKALNTVDVAGKRNLQDHGFEFRVVVHPLRLLR